MATLNQLIKGFRANVREGIPTTLTFTGEDIHLTAAHRLGFVGISSKPSITKTQVCEGINCKKRATGLYMREFQLPNLPTQKVLMFLCDECLYSNNIRYGRVTLLDNVSGVRRGK